MRRKPARRVSKRRQAFLERLEPRCVLSGTVVFHEVMYHPPGDEDALEWVELHNQMAVDMDVSEWRLAEGIDFTFPVGTIVPGGGHVVVAASPLALQTATGFADALGPFSGKLSNAGELLELRSNSGRLMDWLEYGDDGPWPVAPDGSGVSLAKSSPDAGSPDAANWRPSLQVGGTLGQLNFPLPSQPTITTLVDQHSTWRFQDDGAAQNANWKTVSFDDSTWHTGQSLFDTEFDENPTNQLTVTQDLVERFKAEEITGVADGATFTTWSDLATGDGAAQDATAGGNPTFQQAVTLSGKAVVRFDGNDEFRTSLAPNIPDTGGFVYFAVVRANAAQQNGGITDGSGTYLFDRNTIANGNPLVSLKAVNGSYGYQTRYTNGSGLGGPVSTSAISTSDFQIVALRRNATDHQFEIWVDGVLEAATADVGNPLLPQPINIGRHATNGNGGWNGDIAELLMYADELSSADFEAVGTYLETEYGLDTAFDGPAVATELSDAANTYYFRSEFNFTGDVANAQLSLTPIVDDGAVFYLNGQEIHRQNMPAGAVSYGTAALSEVADPLDTSTVVLPASGLVTGPNSFAVEVHHAAGSTDALFGVTLQVIETPPDPNLAAPLVINEIPAASADPFWLELENRSGAPLPIDNYVVSIDGDGTREYTLPAETLAAGAYRVIEESELGFDVQAGDRVFLYAPGKASVNDARVVTNRLRGRSNQHDGRWLYPSTATPAGPNDFEFHDEVVISEILYHAFPVRSSSGDEEVTTLVALDDTWRYEQSDTDLGVAWREPAFDDGGWSSGSGILGTGSAVDYAALIQADAPVAYWTFDESSSGTSDALDQIGNNDGTFGGTAARTSGLVGDGAARFNASVGDTVDVGQGGGAFSFTTGVTIEALVQIDAALGTNRYEELFRKEDGNNRLLFSFQEFGGVLAFGINDGTGYSELDMPLDGIAGRPTLAMLKDGNPHHLAATYDAASGQKAIWIDGTLRYSTIIGAGSNMISGGPATAHIGSLGCCAEPFHGVIDEVALYDYALSDTQIGDHASAATAVNVATPLAAGPSTFYFRHEFTLNEDVDGVSLLLDHFVDDGAIFYLNGVEVLRQNMPAGTVNHATPAASAIGLPTRQAGVILPAGPLVTGTNVLAVELHQSGAGDTDAYFGGELRLVRQRFHESDEEWIELFNRSTTNVDLSGWTLDGDVQFAFPAGTTLDAGEYLVVARDAGDVQAKYPAATVVGSYSGRLSNSDALVQLIDTAKNPADEVHYYDGGRWPLFADGGGSSLELMDPDADNAKAESWRASDETARSTWQQVVLRGIASNTPGNNPTRWSEFVFGLLDAGEFLIDDIHVVEDPDGAAIEFIQNSTFDSGTTAYRLLGTHGSHGLTQVIEDPDEPGNNVLHVVATGPTEHMHNHVETTFANGESVVDGTEYEISFRAKWLGASNQLNTRLYFNRVAETTLLPVPSVHGTPGAANSTAVANAGPTYAGLLHSPIVPAAAQPIAVTVTADDPDGMDTMTLFWSEDGGAWNETMMSASGDSYVGTIPGQAANTIVQFYVRGLDSLGAASTFPAAGPESRALIKVQDGQANLNLTNNFRIIMTTADAAFLHEPTNVMSNHEMPATVVYNEQTVFYDVAVRLRASERGRNTANRVSFNVRFHPDERFRGVNESVYLDRSGGWSGIGGAQDEIVLWQLMNRAGGIPSLYNDMVRVITPQPTHTGAAQLVMGTYSNDYLDSAYANGSNGYLYKYELIYFPTTTSDGTPEGLKLPQPDSVLGVPIRSLGDNDEAYRWNFQIRNQRDEDNFEPIKTLGKTFGLTGTAFLNAIDDVIDVDQWLRAFAGSILGNVGDNYARGAQHNLRLYQRPDDGRVLYMPWDLDFAWVGASTSSLFPNGDLNKMVADPNHLHHYYGHLHDIVTTSFNGTYAADWTASLASLAGQNYSGVLNFITNRANYVLGQLPAATNFEITTNGGADYAVASGSTTLSGDGWVNVREVRLAGASGSLPINWTTATNWEVTLPLSVGDNTFNFEAYDFRGNLIGTDSITVTTTTGTPSPRDFLRITEVMYNPPDPTTAELAFNPSLNNDDFEFLELRNTGPDPIDLTGVTVRDAFNYTFAGGTLNGGQYVVLVRDQTAFELRYGTGIYVHGEYSENLRNSGETVTLLDGLGVVVQQFTYGDSGAWPGRADGSGGSLEVISTAGDYNDAKNWRGSTEFGGSPGQAGLGPYADVVINEVLTHTDPPQLDSVELHNTAAFAIDIGGWYLSDNDNQLRKFRIPSSIILNAGAYIVFDEEDFNASMGVDPEDFAFNGAHGDDVWLTAADASGKLVRFADHVEFGAAANGESFGRWPNGSGELYPQAELTLDAQNSGPRVGPVVISEVHYNPLDPQDGLPVNELEFVELYNPLTMDTDLTNWRFGAGVSFDFANGLQLPAGGTLVVVSFNPTDVHKLTRFRAYYGIDASVSIVGPYSGVLDNGGETIRLERPDESPFDEPDFIPYLLEDEFRYEDDPPWPAEPDGTGPSLTRVGATAWGNDESSWLAAPPSPGNVLFHPDPVVVARRLFYNHSSFDGNDVLPTPADDNAIAVDKAALLPGNVATFVNYSTFHHGTNGILIDVDNFVDFPNLSLDDFEFRVGNGGDSAQWPLAAAPTITKRPDEGSGGADRITLIWNDGVNVNSWLRVAIRAGGATGLQQDDVFFVGNARGDTGNAPLQAYVDALDFAAVREHPNPTANQADRYDLNRDGRVDGADLAVVRDHSTNFVTALSLAAPLAPPPFALLQEQPLETPDDVSQEAVQPSTGTTLPASDAENVQAIPRVRQMAQRQHSAAIWSAALDDPPLNEALEAVLEDLAAALGAQ